MKKVFKILPLALATIMSGCIYYPSQQAIKITESSEREVKRCKLLGQVYGEAKGLMFLSAGLEVAKDQAKEQVAKLGGTHIMWTEVNIRTSPYVLGRAYRCNFKD